MTNSLRDNLLVTMGARAAYMDARGDIALPSGSQGEDILADFVAHTVDYFIANRDCFDTEDCMGFDEFIEKALTDRYGIPAAETEWFGIVRWHEDDIEAALVDEDCAVTPEHISIVRGQMESSRFHDYLVEAGWYFIHGIIANEIARKDTDPT